MNHNHGIKTRPNVLVLESVWSYDLGDQTSVRPFIEGWAKAIGVRVGFRSYHDANDLMFWLNMFSKSKTNPNICYVAGHGSGQRLHGAIGPNINLTQIIKKAFPIKPGPKSNAGNKGILIGACQVGSDNKRQRLLQNTDYPLAWVAGYEHSIPWMESTMADLLFLTYFVEGRVKREYFEDGSSLLNDESTKTHSARKAGEWVCEDYHLISAYGFGATDRH